MPRYRVTLTDAVQPGSRVVLLAAPGVLDGRVILERGRTEELLLELEPHVAAQLARDGYDVEELKPKPPKRKRRKATTQDGPSEGQKETP